MAMSPFTALAWLEVVKRVVKGYRRWRNRRKMRKALREVHREQKEFDDALRGG